VLLFANRSRIKQPILEREKDEQLKGMEFLFENYKPEFWYVASARAERTN